MDDLDRRAVLGVAGIGAVAALSSLAKAGPLTPPSGSVAPTGRTLDEVYNRIPTSIPSADRTPITIPSGGMTLSVPGSYVLTGSVTVPSTAVTITSDGVTLDLNGHTITCSSTSQAVIVVSGGTRSGVTVHNGTIVGGVQAVASGFNNGALANSLLEDLRLIGQRSAGVSMPATTNRGIIVRRCHVCDLGATTATTDTGGVFFSGIGLFGSNNVVEDCTVTRFIYNGTGFVSFRGINIGSNTTTGGNVVRRCVVQLDAPAAFNSIGVSFASTSSIGVYRDNTVINCTTAYMGGTNGGGNV